VAVSLLDQPVLIGRCGCRHRRVAAGGDPQRRQPGDLLDRRTIDRVGGLRGRVVGGVQLRLASTPVATVREYETVVFSLAGGMVSWDHQILDERGVVVPVDLVWLA
jgi:hypothetical protein